MVQPHITYRHMPHSAVLDDKIVELSNKLQELHPRITSIHVIVDEIDRNKEQGRLFEVRLDVKAPKAEIVANHQRHEDPYVAMRDAFDAVMRQINETLDRQRGEIKSKTDERGDNARP
jgi:ribosome-associated translation inhibitor RaiA